MRTREIISAAKKLGTEAGVNAASWVELNAGEAVIIVRIFAGVDPAVYNALRYPNLSGEYADDLTPQSLAEDIGIEYDDDRLDDACSAWEDASSTAFERELSRRCREYLKA